MKVDLRVSERKFVTEIERIQAQAKLLRSRGIIIEKIEYPFIEAIFIPQSPVVFQFPVPPQSSQQRRLQKQGQLKICAAQVPHLAPCAFGVRIGLDDFDLRPPSVVFCDPLTWETLPAARVHPANLVDDDGKVTNVLITAHPITKLPFLCVRGIREYHEHPQHSGDDWLQYRGYINLFTVIEIIWKSCVVNAIPIVIAQPPNQVLFNWSAPLKVKK